MGAFFRHAGAPFLLLAKEDGRLRMDNLASILQASPDTIGISGVFVPCRADGKCSLTVEELRRSAQFRGVDEDGSLQKPFTLSVGVEKPSKFKGTDGIPSPSAAAGSSLQKTLEAGYFYDFRSQKALPVGIFVEAFAEFRELLKTDAEVGEWEWAFVDDLITQMPKVYPEKFRQIAFTTMLRDYLEATTGDMFEVVSNTDYGPHRSRPGFSTPDIKVYAKWGNRRILVALIEVKNELGFCGDPSVQNLVYYAKAVSEAAGTEVYFTGCPQLLMDLVGPNLRVSGAFFQDKAVYEPLTQLMSLLPLHQAEHVVELARLAAAIRKTLCELRELYHKAGRKPKSLCCEECLHWPYRLQELYPSAALERLGWRPVYRVLQVEEPVLHVKFVRGRYGAEVHQQWAELGYAPKFISMEELRDGWRVITMESLRAEDGWLSLLDLKRDAAAWDGCKTAVRDVVMAALSLLKAQQPVMVHGDLRPPNIMLNQRTNEVKFLDFDWAGRQGSVCYPPLLSKQVSWPAGAATGAPITSVHDVELVKKALH